MWSAVARWLFRAFGWRLEGQTPTVPKAIWVVAPHTSNLDFFAGLGTRAALGLPIRFLAKSQLFTWYAGWLFRALGGYPVDRSERQNLVEAVAERFRQTPPLHIALAPEGTRADVAKLKTGFYFMAAAAQVPLILVGFDWPRRVVRLSPPLYVSGDFDADMQVVYNFYEQIHGPQKTWLKNRPAAPLAT